MCDLLMKRKMLKRNQAARLVEEDHKPRVVYLMDGRPAFTTLEAYQAAGLDDQGAIRVCQIRHVGDERGFQRFKFDPKANKFRKL
jgi:hypothetical protein